MAGWQGSFRLQFEINILFGAEPFAREIEKMLREDLERSEPYDPSSLGCLLGVQTLLEAMEWMWGFHSREDEKVWMTPAMPGLAWGSSTAAVIISRTVT